MGTNKMQCQFSHLYNWDVLFWVTVNLSMALILFSRLFRENEQTI